MERSFCLLVISLACGAWAGDGSAQLEACNEQLEDCKENCTIDYGTSVKLRAKLTKFVKKCSKKHTNCRATPLDLQQAGIDVPDEKPKKKDAEVVQQPAPVEREETRPEESPPVVEKVEKAEKVEKIEKAEPKEEEKPAPIAVKKVEKKAEPVAEKPAEKPVEKPKKKKDLDEWDEGDIDR